MKVSVVGLWHLGTVTAACCAAAGHEVIAFDDEKDVVANLQSGALPVDEPGLCTLVASGLASGKLQFTDDAPKASDNEIIWICYDTPVDENDAADTEFVHSRISRMLNFARPGALVLISSQLPVGTTAKLERSYPDFVFAYSPENLRLGKAIEVFTKPDRIVIGVRNQESREKLALLFAPFTNELEWMSIESAEMTKHALNAFLATSVAFINEIASICEKTGADALEVERGLKSDVRIGTKSYLHPGSAFAGGTLARDIRSLLSVAEQRQVPTHLLRGVVKSNSVHGLWAQTRFLEIFGDLEGKTVAVLGLTYKPGTNTLRRSMSVEICRWLMSSGAIVQAFDPAITELPADLKTIRLIDNLDLALDKADAVLVATPWPEFRSIPPSAFSQKMRRAVVLDPARHLDGILKGERAVEYHAIGIVS
jgi:UDPglucose 6-dehydrogenase